MKKSLKSTAAKSSGLKKQTKIVMAQAMEEDPTVFQYDEVSNVLFFHVCEEYPFFITSKKSLSMFFFELLC